jgi:hypothetical protein
LEGWTEFWPTFLALSCISFKACRLQTESPHESKKINAGNYSSEPLILQGKFQLDHVSATGAKHRGSAD